MAISFATPEESGQWRVYGKDPQTHTNIRFKVRPVGAAAHEQIVNEELLANRKKRALANMSALESAARAKAIARRRAHLSLVDSENFALQFVGSMRASMESKLPPGMKMDSEGTILFDGNWSPAAKDLVFDLMPSIVDFVNTKADEISAAEEADEEDTVTAFR